MQNHIVFPDYSRSEKMHFHKKDNAYYPILNVTINKEEREYYFKRQCYTPCSCSEFKLKFGYNPNNNCLSAYCVHCEHRHSKALSQVKNSCKRDNNAEYAYFPIEQRERGRYFCEICFTDKLLKTHHIIEVQDDGTHDAINLQLLCADCHNLTHLIRRIKGAHNG